MYEDLTTKETVIAKMVQLFGCMTDGQIHYTLKKRYGYTSETINRIILSLSKKKYLHDSGNQTYTAYIKEEVDYRMIDAIWVYLQATSQYPFDELMASTFLAETPSQISYIKPGTDTMYEIAVLDGSYASQMQTLVKRYDLQRSATDIEDDDTSLLKYIIVVPNEDIMEHIEITPFLKRYAILEYGETTTPTIAYYEDE